MVLLMTSLCEDADVSLARFTGRDLLSIRSGNDLVRILEVARRAPA